LSSSYYLLNRFLAFFVSLTAAGSVVEATFAGLTDNSPFGPAGTAPLSP